MTSQEPLNQEFSKETTEKNNQSLSGTGRRPCLLVVFRRTGKKSNRC